MLSTLVRVKQPLWHEQGPNGRAPNPKILTVFGGGAQWSSPDCTPEVVKWVKGYPSPLNDQASQFQRGSRRGKSDPLPRISQKTPQIGRGRGAQQLGHKLGAGTGDLTVMQIESTQVLKLLMNSGW